MLAKSDHDYVYYPSTHRRELKKFSIKEIRELHRSATEGLIREARHEGELVGKLEDAIDQTKGHPWTGEIDRKPNGDNDEDFTCLGCFYKSNADYNAAKKVAQKLTLKLQRGQKSPAGGAFCQYALKSGR